MALFEATFSGTTVDRLFDPFVSFEEGNGNAVELTKGEGKVIGEAQHVMFFIGFVAANGEDSLTGYEERQ